jgi:pimeloyl-ACP methyl ester carboxylesterase
MCRMMTATRRNAAHWLLTIVLTGCGTAAPPPGDAAMDLAPDAPSVDASAADAPSPDADVVDDAAAPDDATDAAADAAPLVWTRCRTSFFCADVRVPLDWSRPDGPQVTVGVLRARARRPEQRVGVLMVNYGGPGSSTSDGVADRYPNVLGSAVGAAIADRYDVVAVDWRGHGRSRPALACGFVRENAPTERVDPDPDDDRSWGDYVTETRALQRSCAAAVSTELLARVGTDDMVRDMERVREVLGERQVTYVGYSYGAWLGAMYLTLAPQSLRATVIDAPPAPRRDLRRLSTLQARGFQAALDRFFAWCARDARCALPGRDGGAAGVSRAFDALVARLDRAPLSVGLRPVTGAAALSVLFQASYAPETRWLNAAFALARAEAGDGIPLLLILDESASDDQFVTSYLAVRALDNAASADETPESYRAFLRSEVRAIGAHMPRLAADNVAFVGWPARRATPLPVISAPRAPRALIVASRGDATTPYDGALEMREALGNNSHLLTYEGGRHAASTGVPCAGDVVRAFLNDPTVAPEVTTCPELSF